MFAKLRKGVLAALLLAGTVIALPAAAADAKDVIYKGDAKCTSCHDESEAVPVLSIAKTKHGVAKDGRVPSCTSCHGESEKHANKPEDVKERPATDRNFGKKSKLTADEKSKVCTTCHQGGKHMNWNTSAHSTNDVACTSCHQVHTGHDKVRDKKAQPQVCYTCHKQQRADANKPSHHPIPEGKMTCSDCHNTHGSGTDETQFGQRRVAHPLGAELGQHALREGVGAAVAADVLAHQEDARVLAHRLAHGLAHRLAVADFPAHGFRLMMYGRPSADPRPAPSCPPRRKRRLHPLPAARPYRGRRALRPSASLRS